MLSSQKLLSLPFERKQLSLVQVTGEGEIKASMFCGGKPVAYFQSPANLMTINLRDMTEEEEKHK